MEFAVKELLEFLSNTVYNRVKDMVITEQEKLLSGVHGVHSSIYYSIYTIFEFLYLNKADDKGNTLFSRFYNLYNKDNIKIEDIKAHDFIYSFKERDIWLSALKFYDGYFEEKMYDFMVNLIEHYSPKKIKARKNMFTFDGTPFIECGLYNEDEMKEAFRETINEGDILIYNEDQENYLSKDGGEYSIGRDTLEKDFEIILDNCPNKNKKNMEE